MPIRSHQIQFKTTYFIDVLHRQCRVMYTNATQVPQLAISPPLPRYPPPHTHTVQSTRSRPPAGLPLASSPNVRPHSAEALGGCKWLGWLPSLSFGVKREPRPGSPFPLPNYGQNEGEDAHSPPRPTKDFSIQQPGRSFSSLCHNFPLQVTCPADHQDGRVTIFLGVGVRAWMTATSCP